LQQRVARPAGGVRPSRARATPAEAFVTVQQGECVLTEATAEDAAELLALQKVCYRAEGEIYDRFDIPPLTQTLEEARADLARHVVLKLVLDGRIIGSVRGREEAGTCYIGKLIVDPEHQNQGLGRRLMAGIEARFSGCRRFELFTGYRSEKNLAFYDKVGYRSFRTEAAGERLRLVFMEKEGRVG
jgi:GNAT superfamily N-acetyltransferase